MIEVPAPAPQLPEMPKYRCHKEVRALKIISVSQAARQNEKSIREGGSWFLHFEEHYGPAEVSHTWYLRHHPTAGGYYVKYADDYDSFSPAKAFEEGYSRIFESPELLETRTLGEQGIVPRAQLPSIGRIVHYRLNEQDVATINKKRRDTFMAYGNSVEEGQYVAAIVVAGWSEDMVNLQCFLDGFDTYWATSRHSGATPGTWTWPPRQ